MQEQSFLDALSPQLRDLVSEVPKEGATYELIQGGVELETVAVDGSTEKGVVYPANVTLPGKKTIFDPHTRRNVTMKVVKGRAWRTDKAGAEYEVDVIDSIEFIDGMLKIADPTALEKYALLELHPGNESNRLGLGAPRGGFIFRRVEPAKTAKEQARKAELADVVKAELRQATEAELRVIALRLKQDSTMEASTLFLHLRNMAEDDPEVVQQAMGDNYTKTEALIAEAKDLRVVSFDGAAQSWRRGDNQQAILTVTAEEPTEALVSYLISKPGQNTRKALQALVETAKKTNKRR